MDSLNNEYYSSIVTTFPVWMNTTLQPSDLFPESAEDRQITVTIRTVTLVPSESNSTSLEGNVSRKEGSAINTPELRIALYSIIFLLSVLGNGLVVATLVQNKRMRTVTNVLLLNLAISDLLLSVFCMPFTLVGALLRDFIFGVAMCKLIPFLQAVSVSVCAWTLVTISLERYFAICQPLRSRSWQTLSHIYKMIAIIWIISIFWMSPIACVSELIPYTKNPVKLRCRESWPNPVCEKIFTIYLDISLLVLPMAIMAMAYWLISRALYKGIQKEMENKNGHEMSMTLMVKDCHSRHHSNKKRCNKLTLKGCQPETTVLNRNTLQVPQVKREENDGWSTGRCDNTSTSKNPSSTKPFKRIIRRNNFDKILMTKKRIIKMLFVVVMEFFICWTPLYLFNTISQFHPKAAYKALGSTGISLIQLLAYVSSCCNPITYCFMHKKFRQGFLAVFGCRKKRRIPFGRDASGNNSFYFSSQSTLKTELQCSAEKDDDSCRISRHNEMLAPGDRSAL